MLIDDIKSYNKEIKVGGLLYLIGLIIIVILGVIKEVIIKTYEITHPDPMKKYNQKHFNQHTLYGKNSRFSISDETLEHHQFILSFEDKTNVTLEDEIPEVDIFEKERSKIAKHSHLILDELLASNFRLVGQIIKEEIPKIPLEKFLGIEKRKRKVYLRQRVTFGNQIDKALIYLFNCTSGRNYLIFENGSTLELEQELQEYFMNKEIRIILIDKKSKVM